MLLKIFVITISTTFRAKGHGRFFFQSAIVERFWTLASGSPEAILCGDLLVVLLPVSYLNSLGFLWDFKQNIEEKKNRNTLTSIKKDNGI